MDTSTDPGGKNTEHCTLLRNPLSTEAAFTDRERGIRIGFSRITETQSHSSRGCALKL